MRYLTSFAWRQGEKNSLLLQQVTRRRGRLPILLAVICEEGDFMEQLEEWFYESVLPYCRRNAEKIADYAQKSFQEWMEKRVPRDKGNFAAIFCAGGECFYAWRGDMDIRVLNQQFGRTQVRSLTKWTDAYGCERALLEENVGVLLGAGDFYNKLSQDVVRACLAAIDLNNQRQADRHLAEVCEEAKRRGAVSSAAVLIVTKAYVEKRDVCEEG